jgi:sugar/nucleoside kinase (ribokinase family)
LSAVPAGPVQIVVAGHVCLDIRPAFPSGCRKRDFEPGGLTVVGPAALSVGGAVGNTGLALRRLGLKTRLVGKLGDDWIGRQILGLLAGSGRRSASDMILEPGARTSYSIVLEPPGRDRSFLHDPGANDSFSAADMPPDKLRRARLFHFGYPPVMERMRQGRGTEMARLLSRARRAGLATSLDMAGIDDDSEAGRMDWGAWLRNVLPRVDLFLPSLEETVRMLGSRSGRASSGAMDGPGLAALADRLLGLGASAVGLKLGRRGIYLRTTDRRSAWTRLAGLIPIRPEAWRERELLAPSFRVPAAGTTGAGDCAIAGFLAAFARGLGPEAALACAAGAGAACVERICGVAGLPSWTALRRRIRSGWAANRDLPPLPGWRWDETARLWRGPSDRSPA